MTLADPSDEDDADEPEYESYPVVLCVYCEEVIEWDLQQEAIASHHLEAHEEKKYDPAWYDPGGENPYL